MSGKRFLLYASIALLVLSVAYPYMTDTGSLSHEDPRVQAALVHLRAKPYTNGIVSNGIIMKAWLTSRGETYRVNLGINTQKGVSSKWHIYVEFDAGGLALEYGVGLWTAALVPKCLGFAALALFMAWVWLEFAIPIFFAPKCADCSFNPLRPELLSLTEREVYHGGFDDMGYSMPPIVERTYTCPKCEFTRVRYAVPEYYRDSSKFLAARLGFFTKDIDPMTPMLNQREQRWYDELLKRHAERPIGQRRFATYEEWKQYYRSLKAQEREVKGKR